MAWFGIGVRPKRDAREEEARRVSAAAEALQVSEYNYFRLAYRRWAGEEPGEAELERLFGRYMLYQTVPPPVRHMTRQVREAAREGSLDRRAFGADTVPRRDLTTAYFRRDFVALMMVLMLLAFLLIQGLIG